MDNGKIIFDQPAPDAFDHLEIFHRLGLRVPVPVELCHTLGIKARPFSAEETIPLLNNRDFKEKTERYITHHDLEKRINPEGCSAENNELLISIQNVWSGYDKNRMVLKGINLEICRGERVAVMGTNGSGKSTLLLNLASILKPYKGSIKVFGEDTESKNPYSFAGRIGLVFQNPDLMLFCNSAEEEVMFGPVQLKLENIEERTRISLEAMSILDLKQDLPQSLSRGQRLRTAVASVLSIDPELVLLDEPTTGQDRVNIEQMMDYFKNKGSTLVFCTHDIEIAMLYATRILVMSEGQIIADGKGRDVIRNTDILRKASLTQPPVVEIANYLGINAFSITELVETLAHRSCEVVEC